MSKRWSWSFGILVDIVLLWWCDCCCVIPGSGAFSFSPSLVAGGGGGGGTDNNGAFTPQSENGARTVVVDCAIIGAGPAGVATALGLRKVLGDNAKIAVFERTAAFRRVGGQVGLMRVALNALEALDPDISASVERAAMKRLLLRRFNEKGDLQDELRFEPEKAALVISWFDLQQAMLACLPHDVDVYVGHELLNMIENDKDQSVTLQFTNGQSCQARLVVGADGNLSQVRYLLFGEKPEFAGSCIWRMFIPVPEEESQIPDCVQRVGESNVWTGNGKVLALQKMEDRIYLSGQSGWPEHELFVLDRKRYIGVEDGDESGGTTRNEERLDRFVTALSDFDPEIMQFIRTFCEKASILEHPIFMRPTGLPWGQGRITMIGDAAHMMPPNMAMGTASAFEDAVELARAVQQLGLTANALRQYESTRQPRVNRIAGEAIRQTRAFYIDKDDSANPFQMNNPEMMNFIADFRQDPIIVPTENNNNTHEDAVTTQTKSDEL